MTVPKGAVFYYTQYNGGKNDDKRSAAAETAKIFGGRRSDIVGRAVVSDWKSEFNARRFGRNTQSDIRFDRRGSNAGGRTVQKSANEKSCFN